ncbi:unnamed protein product [Rotaria sordida]|uniref:BZIP domain-containing protein n=1 Tax=Rotaria sordida TaxID=392033 RepID=A0A818N3C8_9BILA|nr:unnamed protein product [Rotaria sordida]
MSSMKKFGSPFDSVDSIVNFLREPSSSEVVLSSTTSSTIDSTNVNSGSKSIKGRKKEKGQANIMNTTGINLKQPIEMLPTGRVRYGPITVNPRKQPSKTLFTGRRSKYEILSNDEDEKRRLRRERNRVAATKCREKRENILTHLQNEYDKELNNHTNFLKTIDQLNTKKQHLESMFSNHVVNCQLKQINTIIPQQPSMVFGDTNFLSSIGETSPPPLRSYQIQNIQNDEEDFNHFLQPASLLTNSAYNNDQSNYILNSEQQAIQMTSSSLDRLMNSLQSPTPYIDNNNNNCSGLYNSAFGSSTCAKQHSSSSEDDSLPSTHKNSFVC